MVRLNLSDLESQSTLFKSVDSCNSYSPRMWNTNPIHLHISVREADFFSSSIAHLVLLWVKSAERIMSEWLGSCTDEAQLSPLWMYFSHTYSGAFSFNFQTLKPSQQVTKVLMIREWQECCFIPWGNGQPFQGSESKLLRPTLQEINVKVIWWTRCGGACFNSSTQIVSLRPACTT